MPNKILRLLIVLLIGLPVLIFGAFRVYDAVKNPQERAFLTNGGVAQAAGVKGAAALNISGFSIQLKDGATYLTINTNRDFNYRIFSLTKPTLRIVMDFDKAVWKTGGPQGGSVKGAGLIKQIRFANKSATQSRVVLDLASPALITEQSFRNSAVKNSSNSRVLVMRLQNTDAKTFASRQPKQLPHVAQSALSPMPKSKKGKYVIVIDAGHGGHDPGALGFTKGVQEKDVTLQSALILRDYLRGNSKYKVVLTRSTDVFIPLEKRIAIARDMHADLFISLHADSASGAKAQGATVYTLSEEGGQRARKLLGRDNWTVAQNARTDDNSVKEILRDLTQRDTKNQSAIFAENIVRNIKDVGPLTSSSHRRAGYYVLLSPTVPAVLLEMGFISDEDDEARLVSKSFREKQMRGVADAINEYFAKKRS